MGTGKVLHCSLLPLGLHKNGLVRSSNGQCSLLATSSSQDFTNIRSPSMKVVLHNGWQKGTCANIVHKHIKYMTKATVAFTPIRTILYLQYTGYTVMNDTLSIDAYYTQNTDIQS